MLLLLSVTLVAAVLMWSWLRTPADQHGNASSPATIQMPATTPAPAPSVASGLAVIQPPVTTPVSVPAATRAPATVALPATPTPVRSTSRTGALGSAGLLAALTRDVNAVTQGGRSGGELDQLFRQTGDLAKRVAQGKKKDIEKQAAEVRSQLADLVRRGELDRATAERLDAQVRALLSALPLDGKLRGDDDDND